MMKKTRAWAFTAIAGSAALLGMLILSATTVTAQMASSDFHKEVHEACYSDAQKLCSGVQPGEGRIVKCLKENRSKLSSSCSDLLTEVHEACHSDAQKFCSGVKPGEGRIVKCLKENSSKLSPMCSKIMEK